MSEATPRITAPYLETFQNQTVRLLGKVIQLRGDHATLDAGGHVNVILTRDSHLTQGHAVEVVGKVTADLSVKVLVSTDFGLGVGEFFLFCLSFFFLMLCVC